jgi:nitroreductase
MNETLKVIAERYSCRDFKDTMPSDEVLQAIAEAGVQAPSARNTQAWRVIVVKDKELINDIESAAISYIAGLEDKSSYERIMKRGGTIFYGAPVLVVVPIDLSHKDYAQIDCGIVCQNIALAATSLGIANLICGYASKAFEDPERARELSKRLGFPEGYTFGCSVLLGYANSTKEPHEPDKDKISFIG